MKTPSGKFVVRLSSAAHGDLQRECSRRGLSLNELCQEKLTGTRDIPPEKRIPQVPEISCQDLLALTKKMGVTPIAILLFGSFARMKTHAGSDIDFLFVFDSNVKIDRSLYRKWDSVSDSLQQKVSNTLSPHFTHLPSSFSKTGSLWLECAIDGVVLFDTDVGLVSKALSEIRRLIAEGAWRRQYAYGQPYWIGETS